MHIINVAYAGVIANAPNLSQAGTNIVTFLLSVFAVVAIIGAVVSGLMYFFAFGDERRMQTAKRSTVACVTGAVIGLGALVMLKFLGQLFQ